MPNKPAIRLPLLAAADLAPDGHATVLRLFDTQILACAQEEDLSNEQQAELTAWARERLLTTYVASQSDAFQEKVTLDELACPCCGGALEAIRHLLEGELPLEAEGMTFTCPPLGSPRVEALHRKVLTWVRRRTTLAAQRTRWHTAQELTWLRAAVEAHLVVGALAWFDLNELLDDLPDGSPEPAVLLETTRACLAALHEGRGLAWT